MSLEEGVFLFIAITLVLFIAYALGDVKGNIQALTEHIKKMDSKIMQLEEKLK